MNKEAYVAPKLTPITELRTSCLMRRCAAMMIDGALPGAAKEVARCYANELHGRAFLLEKAAESARETGDVQALVVLGEVRS